MPRHTFKCSFCNQESGFSKRAVATIPGSANPYAKETRKYRCEACGRINDVIRPGYDWSLIDREQK